MRKVIVAKRDRKQYFGERQKQIHPAGARTDKEVNPDSSVNIL